MERDAGVFLTCAPYQHAAACDQPDQEVKQYRPVSCLIAKPHIWFDEERIGEKREKTSKIAAGKQKIRISRRRMPAAGEPGLQQGTVRSKDKERQADRDGEQQDE